MPGMLKCRQQLTDNDLQHELGGILSTSLAPVVV